MSKKLRVFKLRHEKDDQLLKELEDYKKELNTLRIAKISGGAATKTGRIKVVRKSIAKYLTVINQRNREKVKASLTEKGAALPITFRARKTRAIRRRLTKHQLKLKTKREIKRLVNLPLRKYALKA
eukprot:CAMPEP_0176434224 /NCGR_PEP_ID=MMETSP0127-20121128/16542_1 /TAXON_ID=938130 /ORGANISM="Platyophrya macrostoma, Strain WH" /LENGTH=125 /DNA_ID=CAMNT_0017816905 /DNA_START=35 /DNA_END=412 /DNA_ORIENTATION=-